MVDTYRPDSLAEVLSIMREHQALPFAGGTDLMVRYRTGPGVLSRLQKTVVFLDKCQELKTVLCSDGSLKIGSAVPLAVLEKTESVPSTLQKICSQIGAPGLRNVATLGGNICNASPAGDTLPYLYAVDAQVVLVSADSERTIPIESFIRGPGETTRAADEILHSVVIPHRQADFSYFRKVGSRRANTLTKVSLAGFADLHRGKVERISLAFGAVGPTVIRLHRLEKSLRGVFVAELADNNESLVHQVEIFPINDQRSSIEYRRRVAINLLNDFFLRMKQGRTGE